MAGTELWNLCTSEVVFKLLHITLQRFLNILVSKSFTVFSHVVSVIGEITHLD